MIRGRPFRFLATVLGGWTAMRVVTVMPLPAAMLFPQPQVASRSPVGDSKPALAAIFAPALVPGVGAAGGRMLVAPAGALASARPPSRAAAATRRMPVIRASGALAAPGHGVAAPDAGGWSSAVADSLLAAQITFAHGARPPLALASFAPGLGLSPGEAGAPVADRQASRDDRWSGAAWMLWRRDGDARQPRLGGAQAGVRVDYLLSSSSPLRPTLYGRVSSALHGTAAAEVATGVAVHPDLPFPATIAVERRQALSPGGRSDFAALAAGGVNPVAVGHGFRLDGYGQAGFVGVQRRDGFADGRLTLERPLGSGTSGIGPALAVGAAVWGGIQPGASRIDIGPQASIRMRIGGASMRLGAEWRAQVAGNAAPSSGPALSLGADF